LENRTDRSFLAVYLVTSLCLLAAVGLFNAVMDPFGLYHLVTREGLNAIRPRAADHERMSKAWAIERRRPDAIILGSSRAAQGLSPEHPGWSPRTTERYNLALNGPNMHEVERYFHHAHAVRPQQQVVLALDFFIFNVDQPDRADFDEARLRGTDGEPLRLRDRVASLFSLDALASSVSTLLAQHRQVSRRVLLENGQQRWDWRAERLGRRGHRDAFREVEREFTAAVWRPGPRHGYRLVDPQTGRSGFVSLRRILDTARRDGVDLRLLISPVHARLLIALEAAGLWPAFEAWKRGLVETLAEEAAEAPGREPFPLTDFATFHPFAREPVPPEGDTDSAMRWFWDSSHYKVELGDRMLDRVLGGPESGPADFGVRLAPEGLEGHLARVRAERDRYRELHPEEMAEIEAAAREAR
jgi:hypothetical protein